jgi:hypothetical protein
VHTLINGYSVYSNLCPKYREELCPRGLKPDGEEGEQHVPQVTVAQESGLRDKGGDVLMTDT